MRKAVSSSHIEREAPEELSDLQLQSRAAMLEHRAEHPQLDGNQKHHAKEELGRLTVEIVNRGIPDPNFKAMRQRLIEKHPHLGVPDAQPRKVAKKSNRSRY